MCVGRCNIGYNLFIWFDLIRVFFKYFWFEVFFILFYKYALMEKGKILQIKFNFRQKKDKRQIMFATTSIFAFHITSQIHQCIKLSSSILLFLSSCIRCNGVCEHSIIFGCWCACVCVLYFPFRLLAWNVYARKISLGYAYTSFIRYVFIVMYCNTYTTYV